MVQLPDALRFREDWEKEASLRLRAGDAEVLTEYADHGRVTGAPPDEAKALARRTYVAEYIAGRAPLLMAASNALVDRLASRSARLSDSGAAVPNLTRFWVNPSTCVATGPRSCP